MKPLWMEKIRPRHTDPNTGNFRETHVCGVEDVDDPLQRGVDFLLLFVLLADQLDVPQLAEIKVSFLLHVLDGGFQYLQLWRKDEKAPMSINI